MTGNDAANGIGNAVKSGWNVFHGAGEAIRGTINSSVDNVGEQIAGRGDPAQHSAGHTSLSHPHGTTGTTTTTTAGAGVGHAGLGKQGPEDAINAHKNDGIAATGVDEVKAGLAGLHK